MKRRPTGTPGTGAHPARSYGQALISFSAPALVQGLLSKGSPPLLESVMLPTEKHPASDSLQAVFC